MNKSELLKSLQIERSSWESLLGQIGEEHLTTSGVVGEWSIKDVIAHIMSYEQFILDRLRETLRNEVYVPGDTAEALTAYLDKHGYPDFGSPLLDDDEPNAWVIQRYRPEPLDTVLQKESEVFADLLQIIQVLPEETLAQYRYAEKIASNTTEHYQHHASDIRKWLDAFAA
jgi:hypothetical protein